MEASPPETDNLNELMQINNGVSSRYQHGQSDFADGNLDSDKGGRATSNRGSRNREKRQAHTSVSFQPT